MRFSLTWGLAIETASGGIGPGGPSSEAS
jgi:hypothetical protein